MKISICHYSYHRTWEKENWDCERLAEEVKKLGVDAVDYHVRYLGEPESAAERVRTALGAVGLELSGISMSNNFNQEDPEEFKKQVSEVKTWLKAAAEAGAPVSRIFGAGGVDRSDKKKLQAVSDRISKAIEEILPLAEKLDIVLALENHGGFPRTGEEQVEIIRSFDSPFLKATVDVGNYMHGGQEGHEGTAIAAEVAAYVHFKDFKKLNPTPPWKLEPATLGEGDVDHLQCLKELKKVGYNGYIGLEYEGLEDEKTGTPKSCEYTKKMLKELE